MFKTELRRREWLAAGTAILAGGATTLAEGAQGPNAQTSKVAHHGGNPPSRAAGFLLGLNTSTIRGQKLSIVEELAIAEKAGYQGMEPWVDELERHDASGGSLEDLGKRFRDAGISIESAIGFFEWIVNDPARRRKGLETARRSMELVRGSGGNGWRHRRSGRPIARCPICSRSPSGTAPCSRWATRSASSPRLKSGALRAL